MSRQIKPSIVFSHGIWADGSCFSKLIPTLQAEGHDVIAAQYGLDTLKADVEPPSLRSSGSPRAGRPCRPLLRRHRHHQSGRAPQGRRSGLYLRLGPGRDRDLGQHPGQVSHHRRLPEH